MLKKERAQRAPPAPPDVCVNVCVCRTGADPSGEDPGSGGHSCFDQSFPKNLLQFGRKVKVLQPSVDRDEQRGQLQLPVLHHQVEQVVWFGVIGNPDVLQEEEEQEEQEEKQEEEEKLLLMHRCSNSS